MGSSVFRFKRFTVNQQRCAMKVGTDGTLLGAWCRVLPQDEFALDIGTGTGLIALMIAQRHPTCSIVAVECDGPSCSQAAENIAASEWSKRIETVCDTIQNFADNNEYRGRFDNIVSNPPYFSESLLPPDCRRSAARHTVGLSYDELARCCAKLLSPEGRLSLIVPESESRKMILSAAQEGLFAVRQTAVKTTETGEVKRRLLEFAKNGGECTTDLLTIHTGQDGAFSEQYRRLTEDFYLKF